MKRRQILLSIPLIALGAISGSAFAADEIVVGASVALTGKYARTGQEQLNGIRMWVENVNARGGLLEKTVSLVHYDDESKPDTGAKLYEKLITDDKVDLILGPYSSGVTLAASTIAEKHKFPMVSAGAAGTKVWSRGYKNVFGLYAPDDVYMDQILEFAKGKGLSKVALIYSDTTFPRGIAQGVKAKVKALGMDLVFEEEYGKGSTDFSAIIMKMRRKNPDIIVGGSYLPDSTAFVRQAKENRFDAKILAFAVGPGLPDFGKNLGADSEGVMGNSQWEPSKQPYMTFSGMKNFAKDYEQTYGHIPGYHAAGGYGAGQVLEAAVTNAGSTDRDAVRKALSELDTSTVFGPYKVDASGKQIGKPSYAIQWIDGKRELVLPESSATAKIVYPFKPWSER
ncbi:MAG: amino acid ABC transporter substrate-binding protein [Gammaproteobacteria bacterium]|nr:amino acid ABC transporter substrate-binding protein [Gammaproteobacteria bacterium]NNJ84568.1 amino acid ABC transporter substrate-binding protein [Gammaproteobacteria bacterium]